MNQLEKEKNHTQKLNLSPGKTQQHHNITKYNQVNINKLIIYMFYNMFLIG